MNETYILYPLLRFGEHDRESLLDAIRSLEQQQQQDPYLKLDIEELLEKLSQSLDGTMLEALKRDAQDGSLCGPGQYEVQGDGPETGPEDAAGDSSEDEDAWESPEESGPPEEEPDHDPAGDIPDDVP